MKYGATVDPYPKYNSEKVERAQRSAARFVKSRYSRYSSFSDMLDVWVAASFSKLLLNPGLPGRSKIFLKYKSNLHLKLRTEQEEINLM